MWMKRQPVANSEVTCMADDEVFPGFPTCLEDGFTPFPNAWFDIIMQIDNVAELKVVLYVARHTWGYQDRDGERERSKKIALDEFAHGWKKTQKWFSPGWWHKISNVYYSGGTEKSYRS